jgi:hypothetical protein
LVGLSILHRDDAGICRSVIANSKELLYGTPPAPLTNAFALHVPLPIGPVTIGFPAFAFFYPTVFSDLVGDYTCAGPGRATDQRPFTATGKATDQARSQLRHG